MSEQQQPLTTPPANPDQMHKKLAVDLFNATWDLIDKPERTPEENDAMIHMAHASYYHWSRVGAPQNFAIGAWQIAHVYTLLRHGEAALYHANRCLEISTQNGIEDWQLAFAYEALARAHASRGDIESALRYRDQAKEVGLTIDKEGERNHFLTELAKGPWFDID